MAKSNSTGRILISASDLEHVSRCPQAMNYLPRIRANISCKSCIGLAAAGRYMLQRSFRGTRLPTLEFLVKTYAQSIGGVPEQPWATRYAKEQKAALDHLRDWGKGVWEKIDAVNIAAETHHGLFTIHQLIDVILIDKSNDTYILGQFSCDSNHPEQVLNYKTLHASLWMRDHYGIETNDVMVIRLTPHGPEFNIQSLGLSTNILRKSISSILSTVDLGIFKTSEDRDKAVSLLPPNPGEHCHVCLGCFQTQKEL